MGELSEIKFEGIRYKILELSAQGYTIEQISENLFITVSSVKYHRKKICDNLKAQNFSHALIKAVKRGCLDVNKI